MLQLSGAAGTAVLAGCSGNSNNGNGTTTSSGDGENGSTTSGNQVYDAQHVGYMNQVPTNVQWNPSNPSSYAQISQQLLFDRFAQYNFQTAEFIPYAISDWEFGDNTFTMTVRDGLTWSNGDPVTAGDIATQLNLGMHLGTGYSDYTESIETDGDSTVVMNFGESVNQTVVKFQVLVNNWVQQKESVFGEYLETIQENEEEGLRQLQDFAWSDPITSGPFEVTNTGAQQLLCTRRDDHPDAENINFEEYAFLYIDGNQSVHQSMTADQIDSSFSIFTPPRIVDQLPDHWQQVKTPANWGFGLVPQHDHKHAGDRAVRQAIAYVLNRKQIVENAGPESKQAPGLEVAIPSGDQERILGDAYDTFESYGMDSTETEKAATALEEAGYSKSSGTWKDSDGQTVSLPVQVPSGWSDWTTAAETVVDQLNQFGFQSQVDSRSFGTLLGTTWPNGDFVLAGGGWLPGGGRGSFPYFSLRQQLYENFRGHTYNYPPANQTRGGSLTDVTVPSRTGSGEMTLNPADRLTTLSKSTDQQEITDIILDLAWVTNVDLPMIPVAEKQNQTFITGDIWDIPEQGADISQVQWACTWLPRQGEMNYTGN
jgi:peptide/nickel transport system substrate-binding protein